MSVSVGLGWFSSFWLYIEDLFVQVLFGNGGEKLLLLAEGLLKKHVATHSLHEPEGIFLRVQEIICHTMNMYLLP